MMARFVARNVHLAEATGATRIAATGFAVTQSAPNAARQFAVLTALDQTKLTAKNYIQDGLVAMWDGIENAGWGVHDPNATTWKDLVSGVDCQLVGNARFANDRLTCPAITDGAVIGSHEYATLEVGFVRFGGGCNLVNPTAFSSSKYGLIYDKDFFCANGNGAPKVASLGNGIPCTVSMAFGDSGHGYINGVLETHIYSTYYNVGAGTLNYSTYNPSRGGIADYFFVRLYSRELSAQEVAENFIVDQKRFGMK